VQRLLTSGPRGWPVDQTPWPADPTLEPLTGWLHGDSLHEVVEGNPKLSRHSYMFCSSVHLDL
jgi:hypothetical protein